MPYTTVEKVKAIFTEARLASYMADIENATIQSGIDSASAEIDVAIGRWYALPLDFDVLTEDQSNQIQAMLEKFANAIALYTLIPIGASGVPDGVKIAYDRARSVLSDILKSRYQLPYIRPRVVPAFQMIGDRLILMDRDFFIRSRFE